MWESVIWQFDIVEIIPWFKVRFTGFSSCTCPSEANNKQRPTTGLYTPIMSAFYKTYDPTTAPHNSIVMLVVTRSYSSSRAANHFSEPDPALWYLARRRIFSIHSDCTAHYPRMQRVSCTHRRSNRRYSLYAPNQPVGGIETTQLDYT